MKKLTIIASAAFAMFVALVACQKQDDTTTETPVNIEKEQVTITAAIPEEGLTKVTLTPQEGTPKTIKLAWETTDAITINGEDFSIVPESISIDGRSARFTGKEPAPVGGKYTVTYTKAPDGGFSNQSQDEDGTYDHLGYNVALGNVTDYTNVTFSSTWASSNGATFSQASVLWLRALLPSTVATNVKKVIFKASQNVFNGTNTFAVTLGEAGVKSGDNKLDVYATIPSGTVTSGAMDLLVQFQVDADHEYDKYTAYRQIADGVDFGTSQYIGINCSNITSYAGKDDDGTAAHPYLIGDQHQMQAISLTTTKQYYKLVDDIDLTNVTWTSLNAGGTSIIDLDGNGKTLSHLGAPLFDDLNGTVTNLTISNTSLTGSTTTSGLLANTVATAASTITNVDLSDCSISASAYTGGLIGRTDQNVEITGVDVNNTNVTGTLTGGIVGYIASPATLSECHYSGGTIQANGQYCGGITGATIAGKTIGISDCSVKSASLSSAYNRMGGAIGDMRNGTTVERTVVGVEGTNVTITSTGDVACYIGGFVGLLEGGEIKNNCKAYVAVTGVKTQIGGFIGRMTGGKVSGSTSFGTVTGPGTMGGFFGDVTGATEITGNESQCTVSGTTTYVGGFVGRLAGSISCSNCTHRNGAVTIPGEGGAIYLGGFAGYIGSTSEALTATITSCYVNSALVDGVKYDEKGAAKTSGTFVGGFAGGIGCTTTANNTGKIEKCGVYASDKKGGQYLGGFAGVSYSTIEKCRVTGAFTVKGYGASAGGFCGFQKGNPVSYCYTNAKPNVSGKNYVGGFIGNTQDCVITECYSTGNVSNNTNANTGGMLGYENGNVTCTRLIRWNHSNNNTIVAGETSTPSTCYVKTSSDNNFYNKANSIGWSTDGTIWSYPDGGGIPSLIGV